MNVTPSANAFEFKSLNGRITFPTTLEECRRSDELRPFAERAVDVLERAKYVAEHVALHDQSDGLNGRSKDLNPDPGIVVLKEAHDFDRFQGRRLEKGATTSAAMSFEAPAAKRTYGVLESVHYLEFEQSWAGTKICFGGAGEPEPGKYKMNFQRSADGTLRITEREGSDSQVAVIVNPQKQTIALLYEEVVDKQQWGLRQS